MGARDVDRREFLATAAGAAAAAAVPGPILLGFGQGSPSDTVRVGVIGFGVQGLNDANAALRVPNVSVVAAASCYDGHLERATQPFARVKDHVLLGAASRIAEADARIAPMLSAEKVARIVDLVPDDWLEDAPQFHGPREQREAYQRHLLARLQAPRRFVEEALRARAVHV